MNRSRAGVLFGCIGLVVAAGALPARGASSTYSFTVNSPSSLLTYTAHVDEAFTGTMIGANQTVPVQPTRLKKLSGPFSPCGSLTSTQNDTISNSGDLVADGSDTSNPNVHPGGAFTLSIDTTALTCTLKDLNINLNASGAISVPAVVNNFVYDSYCSVNPGCTVPYFAPINGLSVGTITINSLQVTQQPGAMDSGTLTPNGANTWNFSVNATLTFTPDISFEGTAVAVPVQQIPATLSGTIVTSGASATLTGSTHITYSPPTNQLPPPLIVPDAVTPPTCSSPQNLILTINVNTSTVNTDSTVQLAANGAKALCACDADQNGTVNVSDIFAFLRLWFSHAAGADFDGNTTVNVSDIFAFLRCWFASAGSGC